MVSRDIITGCVILYIYVYFETLEEYIHWILIVKSFLHLYSFYVGLNELVKERPAKPVEFLASYLLRHDPQGASGGGNLTSTGSMATSGNAPATTQG